MPGGALTEIFRALDDAEVRYLVSPAGCSERLAWLEEAKRFTEAAKRARKTSAATPSRDELLAKIPSKRRL